MTTMYKWHDTSQFRETFRAIQQKAQFVRVEEDGSITVDRNAKLPTLTYRGTVKAHGSNASFVYDLITDTFQFQSRERILSLDSDNANFMLEMSGKIDTLKKIIDQYLDGATPEKIAVYGEFCAGNIQKGVAITGLPKMFLIFGVKLINGEESSWVPLNVNFDSPETGIYSILKFQTFEKTIDFSNVEEVAKAQNEIVELTTKVGDECPIGKYFGRIFETDNTTGEGIVWTCQTEGWQSSKFVFKSKDARHSVSKVKTLKVVDTGRLGAIMTLANEVTPGWRLDQGIEAACDLMNGGIMSMDKIGAFLKFVNTDIVKEESQKFVDAQIPMKEVFPYVSKIGRDYFIERFNKEGV